VLLRRWQLQRPNGLADRSDAYSAGLERVCELVASRGVAAREVHGRGAGSEPTRAARHAEARDRRRIGPLAEIAGGGHRVRAQLTADRQHHGGPVTDRVAYAR